MPGLNLKPHRHFGFEFIYLASGKMDWKVGGRTFAQSGGDLFVAYPDELHESDCPSTEQTYQHWIGLHLADLGPAGNRLVRLLRRDQVRLVKQCHAVEPILHAIVQQITTPMVFRKETILGYLRLLLLVIEQNHRLETEPRGPSVLPYSYDVQKALSFLERRVDLRISLAEMAAAASARQTSNFCAKFRREVGVTPAAYHFSLRLAAARDALLEPEVDITVVALRFGFSSSQHFSTAFRKHFGCTPRDWMRQRASVAGPG